MRLYRGKVPLIAEEITDTLIAAEDIEVLPEMVSEVQLDIEAVLNEYRRRDREILERAKDAVASRNLEYSQTHRIRQRLAEKEGFGIGDKAMDYVIHQLLEVFLHSRNVEEVYAEDNLMRRKMVTILKSHTEIDRDLDLQVKNKIKNLQEGTTDWEIEYGRVMGDLRRTKGLS